MTSRHYLIAEHLVEICYKDVERDGKLLPSFKPFLVSEDSDVAKGTPVVRINVSSDFRLQKLGLEVGQFDCGGSNHGVYLTDDGCYQFEVSNYQEEMCAVMQANKDFSEVNVGLLIERDVHRSFGLNNCIMMAYAFSTATMDTLLMHSSVIRKDGYGYMMTAPSGTGKSTHTHLWYKNIPDCDLMNDDNPVVRIVDGVAMIFGSPWSGKTACYRNIKAPVGAIIRIKQMPQNEIRQLGPVQGFAVMLPAVSSMKWDKRVYSGVCDAITHFLERVKVYELGCLPDAEAALLCYSTVRVDKQA